MLSAPKAKFVVLQGSRIAAWSVAIAILVLSVVPARLRPETGAPHNLEHFAIFALAGITFGYGYSRRPLPLGVALVLFAGFVELIQLAIPGRHARLSDFIVDAVASCIGVALASVLGAHDLQDNP